MYPETKQPLELVRLNQIRDLASHAGMPHAEFLNILNHANIVAEVYNKDNEWVIERVRTRVSEFILSSAKSQYEGEHEHRLELQRAAQSESAR